MKYAYVSSNITGTCHECKGSVIENAYYDNIAHKIQHYVDHGYKLKHVGTETHTSDNDELYHTTVAVLEKK